MKTKWLRVRFKSDADDHRPIYNGKNPEGPWWCSGYTYNEENEISILIAYVKSKETIFKQWPEAKDLEIEMVEKPIFSDRFPMPNWWIETI